MEKTLFSLYMYFEWEWNLYVCLKRKCFKTYNFIIKGGNFQMVYCKLLPKQEMTIWRIFSKTCPGCNRWSTKCHCPSRSDLICSPWKRYGSFGTVIPCSIPCHRKRTTQNFYKKEYFLYTVCTITSV